VLDVGSGGGDVSAQLALIGHGVTALDYSYDSLKGDISSQVKGVEFVNGDATCLPFEAESFDVVVCNSALEHFPNDDKALSEMARVAKKGGNILITTDSFPQTTSPWLKRIPSSWRRENMRHCEDLDVKMRQYHQQTCFVVNYYHAESLKKKMEALGLEINEWRYYMNGRVSKAIYELHLLLKWLDFYNKTSRRLFPLFYPFTFGGQTEPRGYGLAVRAVKSR